MKKPSPAIIVSTLALAVATTGTAGAASGLINGSRIKPHSITAKQIKTHAITKAALADGVIVNNTIVAPAGPQGAPGDTISGPQGASGPTGSPGTPKVWGYVAADGTLDLGHSQGLDSVSRVNPNGGYCVTPSEPVNVLIVSVEAGGGSVPMQASWGKGSPCASGAYFIRTFMATGAAWSPVDAAFSILAA